MTLLALDDPYHALGLNKEATAADIKTAYRKLVLKHHPDKVQDETLKQAAADLFHKIQSAWEKIGDEEKRSKYDARAHLESLRREVSDRERSYSGPRSDVSRPAAYRSESRQYQAPRDLDRGAYRTEEIRPQDAGYFGEQRPLDRRDFDVQQDRPKRTPPREDRRSKTGREEAKEAERQRQREKVRQTTKATARNRDYKYASTQPEMESASDSDRYERRRSPRERVEERRPSERYSEQGRRPSEDISSRYVDERLQRQHEDVRDYIERTARRQYPDAVRRPSPTRISSRDHTDYIADASGRPVAVRRGSGRPKTLAREDSEVSRRRRRDPERSSGEYDDHLRRPPALSKHKSAPNDFKIPTSPYDKPRSNSAQLSSEQMKEFIPTPVKRADSMPQQPSRRDEDRTKPPRSSNLRQTQFSEDFDRRPSQTYAAPLSRSPKKYADDDEEPTPDGYVIREPLRGYTRSPEPVSREKSRSHSSRYAGPPLNTRVTSYYDAKGEPITSRPKLSREGSRKDSYLFGEVAPTSASPRERSHVSPAFDRPLYQEIKPEYKMNSGHSRRPSTATRSPSYMRGNSFNMPSVSA